MQIAMEIFFCRSFLIFAVKNSGKKFYATGPLCLIPNSTQILCRQREKMSPILAEISQKIMTCGQATGPQVDGNCFYLVLFTSTMKTEVSVISLSRNRHFEKCPSFQGL